MTEGEEPLDGGNSNLSVVRAGDTVRRAGGPWTPAVHELLEHLAERSYPAPRPLGFDDRGREVLSYVPGRCVHPDAPDLIADEAGLRRVGRLIADYHRAQEGFAPSANTMWRDEGRDPTGSTEVLAHNDLAPWNLVAGPSGWVFIDWDLAAPGRRFWDLAWALHSFVGMWPDPPFGEANIPDRIQAFCDGAEVGRGEIPALLDVVVERTSDHAEMLRRRAAEGDRHYVHLVDDGHADRWDQGARYVGVNKSRWHELLPE
ncbi:MAG: aminoglycoside phosphotransferase family protein [Actinomycetota bacterium]